MTGVTAEATAATYAKRLQMLSEIVPRLSHLAVLYAPGDANARLAIDAIAGAAPSFGAEVILVAAERPSDLENAFARMRRAGAQGLVVVGGSFTWTYRQDIAALAMTHRLPSVHLHRESVEAGGLISLGPDLVEISRQGATYVDRILRGSKPAELPVEQPLKYNVHINLKTAKALGLTIPPSLLARADQIIE